jgi:hypothetical protein
MHCNLICSAGKSWRGSGGSGGSVAAAHCVLVSVSFLTSHLSIFEASGEVMELCLQHHVAYAYRVLMLVNYFLCVDQLFMCCQRCCCSVEKQFNGFEVQMRFTFKRILFLDEVQI